MVKVSVILPTYGSSKYLALALQSLQEQNISSSYYEIIVVDNAPADHENRLHTLHNGRAELNIIYVKEPNTGLHMARHAGAKIASGEILAFVDDDAIYHPSWLREILSFYSDEKVGCVGGKILLKWEIDPPHWLDRVPKGFFSQLDLGNESKELSYPGIYGANFSIRKQLLFQVGGFNPDSFGATWLGDGETGLLRKILQTKYKIIYQPKAICWHIIPAGRLTLTYVKKRAFNQGACDSYAAFKKNQFGKPILLIRCVGLVLYLIFHKIFGFIKKILRNNGFFYHEWRASYAHSRLCYEFNLFTDTKLRNFVLKDNWLKRNNEINN